MTRECARNVGDVFADVECGTVVRKTEIKFDDALPLSLTLRCSI